VLVTAPPEHAAPEVPPEDPTAFGSVIETDHAVTTVETLSDLLAESVGVHVRRFGGLGDFSTVSVRGFSPGQVQVYLDGVPLSRADNETVNLSELPVDLVDRIEVYRSATPLAFAQAAPGGVVNVVSRRPPRDRPLWAASASGESFGTRKADLAHGATRGRWEYVGFLNYLGSEGDFEFTNDLGTTANPDDDRRETRQNNAFDQVGALARLRYRTDDDTTVTLASDTFWKDEGVPGLGSKQALDTQLRTTRQVGHVAVDAPAPGGWPLSLAGRAYALYEHVAFDDPEREISFVPTKTRTDSLATGGQVVARGALGGHQILGALAAIGHERFEAEDELQGTVEPDRTRLRGALAAEDEIVPFGDWVSIVPSVRWEIVRDDFPGDPSAQPPAPGGTEVEDYVLPRLGASLRPTRWLTLLGNVGRSVRVPNLQELFGTRGVVVGNPDLVAEEALLRDAGARIVAPAVAPVSDAALEYAYFDNEIDDMIVFVQNTQRIAQALNVGRAVLRGHEVSARARVADRVALTVNYTRQEALDDTPAGTDVTFRGNHLPGRPEDELYARIELAWSRRRPIPGLGALAAFRPRIFYDVNWIAGNFLDRANTVRVDERVLHGVGVSFSLPQPVLRPLRLTFEVRNAGDDETRDVLGFPLPGRAFSGTLSWGFGGDDTE
jgi:iron complex outermembrane receptor protein